MDVIYLYGRALGLSLFMLTDGLTFHLESTQSASQDKVLFFQDFSFYFIFKNNLLLLWALQES